MGYRQEPGGMGGVDKSTRNLPIGDFGLNQLLFALRFFSLFFFFGNAQVTI